MSKMHTWTTTHMASGTKRTFSVEMPTSFDETELIIARYGSPERALDCAARQRTVDVAPGLRILLGRGDMDGADAFAESFCDDGTRKAADIVTFNAEEAKEEVGFTDEQLAWAAARGVKLT